MSKKKETKNDGLLGQVYNSFDGIGQEIQFLQCVFGFLNRRSTFLSKAGVSKQVNLMVNKYIDTAKKNEIARQQAMKKQQDDLKKQQEQQKPKVIPKVKPEVPIQPKPNNNNNNSDNNNENNPKPQEIPNNNDSTDDIKMGNNNEANNNENSVENKAESNENKDNNDNNNNDNNDDNSDEEITDRPVGNGGTTDKYVWTQTLSEVEVKIEIDSKLRAKNLDVKIKRKSLYVGIKGNKQFGKEIVNGELNSTIDEGESTWTLDKEFGKQTKTLTIVLCKDKGMTWWSRVIVGDPEIDTKKIEPESSKLTDLDDETRATVEKMMFDQRQKMKGLPTSKEIENKKILDKFKQQHPEMDFSNVRFN